MGPVSRAATAQLPERAGPLRPRRPRRALQPLGAGLRRRRTRCQPLRRPLAPPAAQRPVVPILDCTLRLRLWTRGPRRGMGRSLTSRQSW